MKIKVKILKKNAYVPGEVGAVVECDDAPGCSAQCFGLVEILERGVSTNTASVVVEGKPRRVAKQKDGEE